MLSKIICVDCGKVESQCECQGVTSTPIKEICLSEHITQTDADRILADFQRQPDWSDNTIRRLIAFVFEAGDENGYTRAKEGN